MAPRPLSRLIAVFTGLCFVEAFQGLVFTQDGIFISFGAPFTRSSPGELRMWLGQAMLLLPGGLLIGWGIAPELVRFTRLVYARLSALDAPNGRALSALLGVAAVPIARASNAFFTRGFPITDDELAAQFGGRILANGALTIPSLPLRGLIPEKFLLETNGRVTSFDWIGIQAAWAIAERTGLGAWVFALAVGLGVFFLAETLRRLFSPFWAVVGAALFFLSPMATTLSATTHGHVLSRTLWAGALWAAVGLREEATPRRAAALGLVSGLLLVTRPIEAVFFFCPLFLLLVWEMRKETRVLARLVVAFLIALAVPLGLMALHAHGVTGNALLPPRLSPLATVDVPAEGGHPSVFTRFQGNSGYNLFMLTVWFLGPLGIVFVCFGALVDRFSKALTAGVFLVLGLGLFHDSIGIHAVGPIHYSDAVVPLVVLAVLGVKRLSAEASRLGISRALWGVAVAVALSIELGNFSFHHLAAIRDQAFIHQAIYGRVEMLAKQKSPDRPPIVLAPEYIHVWQTIPQFRERGSWVFYWRRPLPDFSDPVLILVDVPGAEEAVRKLFPRRSVLRLGPAPAPSFFRLERLGDS
jgi:hypothetical protein